MEVRLFDKSIEKFIKGLKKPTIAKVLRTIDLLEEIWLKIRTSSFKENFTSSFRT